MGCRMSRTSSTEEIRKIEEKNAAEAKAKAKQSSSNDSRINGQSKNSSNVNEAYRPAQPANGNQGTGKPIVEVESASQADFFRMLDDKIAHGKDLDSEAES
ncbi:unnamed protein product [Caenorhabditis auriculariae]|uniref:Uncharacterized protein n=1 Tax=Caenorhabditis auriculariae TaxID=2777116 RepID=A0A8S1GVU6_9PELO|nr:unnamed protein product [Caenorhabditis auriculariae]